MKTLSITDTRANLSDLVRQVEVHGDSVGITVQGRVQAILGPTTPPPTAGPWVQVARSFTNGSRALPQPFNTHAVDDGGVHPVLWLNTVTGAMVAAIATGRWDTPGATFNLFYSHPDLDTAVPMLDWTSRITGWSGRSSNEYDAARDQVIELLHEVLPRS